MVWAGYELCQGWTKLTVVNRMRIVSIEKLVNPKRPNCPIRHKC